MSSYTTPVFAPVVVPIPTDNGSWKVHAKHCPECRLIYEEETKLQNQIFAIAFVLVVAGFIFLYFKTKDL
jgi:hypothetical protein